MKPWVPSINMIRLALLIAFTLLMSACTGLPDSVKPVKEFEVKRYLGKWYEIARLDHSFESGLSHVNANYSMRDDGGIRVINRGYSTKEKRWQQVEGKAYFVDTPDKAHLKVSFFGPFYGSYAIFELDHESYQYAFVSGYNQSYLWLLARTPVVEQKVVDRFIQLSTVLGFNTDKLIMVDQKSITEP